MRRYETPMEQAFSLYTEPMRFRCIITFRTSRSQYVSTWKTEAQGPDHMTVAAEMIAELRKRQRRRLTIIGVLVHDRDAAAPGGT